MPKSAVIVYRLGKTARDRVGGAEARRLSNRERRVSWQQRQTPDTAPVPFPEGACNGQRAQARRAHTALRAVRPKKRHGRK